MWQQKPNHDSSSLTVAVEVAVAVAAALGIGEVVLKGFDLSRPHVWLTTQGNVK